MESWLLCLKRHYHSNDQPNNQECTLESSCYLKRLNTCLTQKFNKILSAEPSSVGERERDAVSGGLLIACHLPALLPPYSSWSSFTLRILEPAGAAPRTHLLSPAPRHPQAPRKRVSNHLHRRVLETGDTSRVCGLKQRILTHIYLLLSL